MKKWHIKPDGTIDECRAEKGKCPFGGDDLHFASPEDAERYIQNKMERDFIKKQREFPGILELSNFVEQTIRKMRNNEDITDEHYSSLSLQARLLCVAIYESLASNQTDKNAKISFFDIKGVVDILMEQYQTIS